MVGLIAAVLLLAGCEPVVLVAGVSSISVSISFSEEHETNFSAKLTPKRVRLRPGEEVTLELELQQSAERPRAFALTARVDPSGGIAIILPTDVTAPRGKTRVPVRVVALPSVIPGRYDIEIRIRAPD